MSYLTQMLFDCINARQMKLWKWDNYDWHKAVWKAFPGRDGKQRDFLSRLDEREGGYRVLIVSPDKPTRPDWCPPECWQTKSIPENYFENNKYAFQLCANPTKKVSKERINGSLTKNGRRIPLRTREELVSWMKRKGEQGGFQIEADRLRTMPHGPERFHKNSETGIHSVVEFQGILTITDPAKFNKTFTQGIGSAKAFGFGMLAIVPLK